MSGVSDRDEHDHDGRGHAHAAAHAPGPHAHAPGSHAHAPGHVHRPSGTLPALQIGLVLTAGFAVVEAIAGWLAGSLALISDAGHMATDAAAFTVALIAALVARRPPSPRATYGYARAEVIAAFVNALAMLALVVWIAIEAVQRMLVPVDVEGGVVLGVATTGLLVNLFVAFILMRSGGGLNARGALLHVMGDILGSVAAIVAGAVIVATGWMPIDPILSIVVSVLILRSTIALLRQSTLVLMERVPAHLSYEAIGQALAALPGVTGVHDLHIWNMTAERPALSAHLTLAGGDAWPGTLATAQRVLAQRFGIDHVTLQPSWPAAAPAAAGAKVIPVVPAARS